MNGGAAHWYLELWKVPNLHHDVQLINSLSAWYSDLLGGETWKRTRNQFRSTMWSKLIEKGSHACGSRQPASKRFKQLSLLAKGYFASRETGQPALSAISKKDKLLLDSFRIWRDLLLPAYEHLRTQPRRKKAQFNGGWGLSGENVDTLSLNSEMKRVNIFLHCQWHWHIVMILVALDWVGVQNVRLEEWLVLSFGLFSLATTYCSHVSYSNDWTTG